MAKRVGKRDRIRVGVVGVRRGEMFARGAAAVAGMELAALCDLDAKALAQAGQRFGVATYTEFDKLLEHDLDAVVLANYFHEHAPLAIRALKAGKHVMSETSACFTLAQGVELIRTVEKTRLTYMFAENYPFMLFNQEMRRVFQSGKLGSFMYGEGEYVHPAAADFWNSISPGLMHWRNWLPATYYCTHALGPIMYITGAWPAKVNGFVIQHAADDPVARRMPRVNDAASMIAVRMDNGAVVKLLQARLRGESIWVRIHGSRGQMENSREHPGLLRLRREQYHQRRTEPEEQLYRPRFPFDHDKAMAFGHGGSDYFTNYHFARAIRTGQPPFLDVYRGVAMSIVGILAYRSALADSASVTVPDLRKESARRRYANDAWAPDPTGQTPGAPPSSVRGAVKPTPEALAYARKIWRATGYAGE